LEGVVTYSGSDDAFEQTVETQATEEPADEVEDSSEQEGDSADDLGEGF
jgi:hypothetical protein